MVESLDPSEVGSGSLGEKRPLENGLDRELGNKRAKRGGKDVNYAGNVKKVAEIVLVLATMGKMRAGRKPTAVEVQMMAEARERLADVCKEFAPKDIFPRDAFGTVIEDLGLNGLREQKLGIRSPKLSISERLQVTKQKMEKSEVFPLHHNNNNNMYTPPRLQSNLSGAAESRATSNAGRMFQSDKTNVTSGSFQHPSNVVHVSAANSRSLPYQLPTSEVRPAPGASNILHTGRDSSSRADRPHFRVDGGANGSPYTSHSQAGDTGKTPTWSMQPQTASFAKVGSDKVPVKPENSSDLTTTRAATQGITSKPLITQVPQPNPMNARMNFIQAPSAADTHSEISKIVHKFLHPHVLDHPTWTPPSRDYMNKALICQICKVTINEVDNTLVCDACERGYHLRCLHCNPKAIPRGEWQEWHCAKCLAISNGKPLPPKYGRVMRNISTPKLSSNSVAVQPSLDKKVESSDANMNQQMITANGESVSQSASGGTTVKDSKLTEMTPNENQDSGIDSFVERSNEGKLTIMSELQPPVNVVENHDGIEHTMTQSITKNQSQNNSVFCNVPEENCRSGKVLESGHSAGNKEEQGDSVKTSETSLTVVSNHEDPPSSSMHQVEWIGDMVKEVDGKTYYQSCSINGTVYKAKDYALFSSPGNKYLPNKLQVMWEDGKTTKKWITVTRCFFAEDLPEGVGRPCAPESNEVYESNHETTLAAGLIHGPCEVLPPSKFAEESVVRTRSRARSSDRSKPLFLCKWFYDETKRLFRDVTC